MVYRPRRSWGLGFARDNALTPSADDSAWEDAVFVSRKDAKPAKESQKRKTADPEALRAARGPDKSKFPESEGAVARLHTEEELQARRLGYQLVPLATTG